MITVIYKEAITHAERGLAEAYEYKQTPPKRRYQGGRTCWDNVPSVRGTVTPSPSRHHRAGCSPSLHYPEGHIVHYFKKQLEMWTLETTAGFFVLHHLILIRHLKPPLTADVCFCMLRP